MLSVENVCKSIGALTLNGISFEARVGSYLVLLGASGVGKSVLLETIAGLIQPDSGHILLDGKDITNERMQRRGVGLVFQDGALFPHRTVFGNIAYPLRWKKLPSRTIRQRVSELAEETGVTALLNRSCATLSGGEIQRVSLARALAAEPRCLLLDEPLSSLDPKARAQMRGLLRKIHRRGKHAIVHVTHDYTEAVALATRVAVMEHGTIVQTGTVDETFRRPKSEFVARFVGIKNFFKGELQGDNSELARSFRTDSLDFSVLAEGASGNGFVCIRSEDITISNGFISDQDTVGSRPHTSARNNFVGTILDIAPAAHGMEVIIDIGRGKPVELAALVTGESVESMALHCGKKVRAGFKASAVSYIEQ
jgi:molybdate/tungstate transport system ATP-binding protein